MNVRGSRSQQSQRVSIAKADAVLADLLNGGRLTEEAASKFIQLINQDSVLLQMTTSVPMRSPEKRLDKIRLAQRVVVPDEGIASTLATRAKPDFSDSKLLAKAFKATIFIKDELYFENIERRQLRTRIMRMLAEKVREEMEDIAINSRLSSTDPYYAQRDGLLAKATTHVVDHGGQLVNADLFHNMLMALPERFSRYEDKMHFLMGKKPLLTYRRSLAQRDTNLGDAHIEQNKKVSYSSIPLTKIPYFPDQPDNVEVLLCRPKNIHVGILQEIKVETDRDIDAGVDMIVVRFKFDVTYMDTEEVVRGINLTY